MKIFSWLNPPASVKEKGGGKRITESAGYRSAQEQIESFLLAGKRLNEARAEMYNTDAEIKSGMFNENDSSDNELLNVNPAVNMTVLRAKQAALNEKAEKREADKKAMAAKQPMPVPPATATAPA